VTKLLNLIIFYLNNISANNTVKEKGILESSLCHTMLRSPTNLSLILNKFTKKKKKKAKKVKIQILYSFNKPLIYLFLKGLGFSIMVNYYGIQE